MKNIFSKFILSGIALTSLFMLNSCQEVEYPEHSQNNQLTSMQLSVKVPQVDPVKEVYSVIDGVIDQTSHSVTFNVPYNLSESLDDVTDLTHTFLVGKVPIGAIITPGLGGVRDLTSPMSITVTAADGTETDYTITANLKKSSSASITSFKFTIGENVFTGIPNEENNSITYLVATPDLSDLIATNKAVADIELSPRATIVSPDLTTPIDFSKDVVVKVKAQDGTVRDWTIKQAKPVILDYGFGYARKKWQLSCDDMGFGSTLDVRGMTVTKNYLVIHGRYFEHRLYDKNTGAYVGTTATPSDLSDTNKAAGMYITTDGAGKLVAGSFTSWTTGSNFVIYYYKNGETSDPQRILQVPGLGDCGRKFSVAGDLSSGTAFIYATKGKGNLVYRFHFENGVYKDMKSITVTAPSTSFTYLCTPVPLGNNTDSQFILVDQQATGLGSVNLYSADGTLVSSMSDGAKCMEGGITADGRCFSFNNATYLMYNDCNADGSKARIRIYDITSQDIFSMSATDPRFLGEFLKFTSGDFVNSVGNGNGTGSVAYELSLDGESIYVYCMLTGGGVMKYELTKIKI